MNKNLLLTTLLTLMLSASAFSQFGIKAGFALGEPLNDNGNSNMHLGFDVGVTYDISENLRGEFLIESIMRSETVTFPFLGSSKIKSGIMPITVGLDYRILTDKFQPYAGLNLGLYRFSASAFGNSSSDTYFGLYPKIGASVEITDNILVDATLKYHVVFNGNNQGPNGSNASIFGANFGLIYKIN